MTRNRASAKKAGTAFEFLVATYLAEHVDDRIERRARTGAKDRGDISGLRHMGARVVIDRWCDGCPIVAECDQAARELRVTFGTWAGKDRTKRGQR